MVVNPAERLVVGSKEEVEATSAPLHHSDQDLPFAQQQQCCASTPSPTKPHLNAAIMPPDTQASHTASPTHAIQQT
ncbi:hypothetical protein BC567DRAFT_239710 [Phyllosticta citribraziliensis]